MNAVSNDRNEVAFLSDINECASGNGGCSHTCVNSVGSYRCECDQGYQLDSTDRHTCVDTKECDQNKGGCGHICQETDGSFICSCRTGFQLASDGRTCSDVNECATNSGGCTQRCVNSEGSYRCECNNGYQLDSGDQHTCVGMKWRFFQTSTSVHLVMAAVLKHVSTLVEVMAVNATKDTSWTPLIDTHVLTYKFATKIMAGAAISVTRRKEVLPAPVGRGINWLATERLATTSTNVQTTMAAVCKGASTPSGSYHCECNIGYHLDNSDLHTCVDKDECSAGTHNCDQTCTNTVGSFECSCPQGYDLATDRHTCNDINECQIANGGCSHQCHNNNGQYHCSCRTGYTLKADRHNCEDVNECQTSKGGCSHLCHNDDGHYHCSCPVGYRLTLDGHSCQDPLQPMKSCEQTCDHDCAFIRAAYRCTCRAGFILASDQRSCTPASTAPPPVVSTPFGGTVGKQTSASHVALLLPLALVGVIALLALIILAVVCFTLRRRRKLPQGGAQVNSAFENNLYGDAPVGTHQNREQRIELQEVTTPSHPCLPPPYPGPPILGCSDPRMFQQDYLQPKTCKSAATTGLQPGGATAGLQPGGATAGLQPGGATAGPDDGAYEALAMATSHARPAPRTEKQPVSVRKSQMYAGNGVNDVYEEFDMVKK
ncbi:hypothetical protein LSAT2_025085 [Lamellibrachia satsuma]|nr:hypothetical protein LSAT2_025085 [Lamellibrachia satsuma]